jgi:hypothetical protein
MGILNDPHESGRQTDRQIDSGINVDENKPTTTASALCLVLVVVGVIYIQNWHGSRYLSVDQSIHSA